MVAKPLKELFAESRERIYRELKAKDFERYRKGIGYNHRRVVSYLRNQNRICSALPGHDQNTTIVN